MKRVQDTLPRLVNQLIELWREDDPTVDLLLSRWPWLSDAGWINRCGPDNWLAAIASLSTPQLEWLIKIVVIAESHLKGWGAGSVASAIWLFRAYEKRSDGDWRQMADWILRNRGGNNYLPFGFMTAARSLDGWYSERASKKKRYEVHLGREQHEQDSKKRRTRAAQERHIARHEQSAEHKKQLISIVEQLRSMPPYDRLVFISEQSNFPLEAIPNDLLEACVNTAHSLRGNAREMLLERIDRRNSGVWKKLRLALQ